MKLWILYSSKYEYENTEARELMAEAAKKKQLNFEVLFYSYFSVVINNNNTELYYKDKIVTEYPKVVLSRGYNIELLKFLDSKGVVIINGAQGTEKVLNKYETHLALVGEKITQPKTISPRKYIFEDIKSILGLPFVMKDNFGSQGEGVFLINSKKSFENALSKNANTKFIFQEYIKSSKGSDIRVYVVGKKVIAAINRKAKGSDFRANISLGGSSNPFKIDRQLKKQSLLVAKKLGLEVCGIDFLFGEKGKYIFCEANGNAGYTGFVRFGIVMQDIIIKYIYDKYLSKKQEKKNKKSFKLIERKMPVLISQNMAQKAYSKKVQ